MCARVRLIDLNVLTKDGVYIPENEECFKVYSRTGFVEKVSQDGSVNWTLYTYSRGSKSENGGFVKSE